MKYYIVIRDIVFNWFESVNIDFSSETGITISMNQVIYNFNLQRDAPFYQLSKCDNCTTQIV